MLTRLADVLGTSRWSLCVRETPNLLRHYARRIVEVAESELGKGELCGGADGNNRGPHVERYRAGDGTGRGTGGFGAWCACFASYVATVAAGYTGTKPERITRPFKASRGAKALVRNVARAGRWVCRPGKENRPPEPGDFIAWHHSDAGDWRGHVEIVKRYDPATDDLTTIGGNKNNRTDHRGRRFAVVDVSHYAAGSWRVKLFGVARCF